MTKAIKVFHVEDYTIMREGIKFLLSQDPDIEMVGQTNGEAGLFEYLQSNFVDVVIMDLVLNSMQSGNTSNGFLLTKKIRELYPNTAVLAHSAFEDAVSVEDSVRAGASGFVSKQAGVLELATGIKLVFAGKKYFCTKTIARMKNLNNFLLGVDPRLKEKNEVFSSREREILGLLSVGASSKEISATLFITERTVESHRSNMLDKSKTKNTAALIAYCTSQGLLRW